MPALIPLSDLELYDRSPFLLKLSKRRLAPSRLSDLIAAAQSNKPPKEPDPWDCCGSSCKPCVRELWREEKRVWSEVHPEGEEEESEEEEGGPDVEIRLESQVERLKVHERESDVESKDEEKDKEAEVRDETK